MSRYTHNYEAQYDADAHGDEDSSEYYTEQFEREAAEYLQGLTREDVGGVVCYYDAEGLEAAYFDYENLVGSIYAITGKRSDEI